MPNRTACGRPARRPGFPPWVPVQKKNMTCFSMKAITFHTESVEYEAQHEAEPCWTLLPTFQAPPLRPTSLSSTTDQWRVKLKIFIELIHWTGCRLWGLGTSVSERMESKCKRLTFQKDRPLWNHKAFSFLFHSIQLTWAFSLLIHNTSLCLMYYSGMVVQT